MSKLRHTFLDKFWDINWVTPLGEGDADALAREIIDLIISALRRDPRWCCTPRCELELVLADAEREIAARLGNQITDTAPFYDTLKVAAEAAEEAFAATAAEVIAKAGEAP